MFLELAELLPSPEQRAELLRAAGQAGWATEADTAGADTRAEDPLKVHSYPAGPPSCTVFPAPTDAGLQHLRKEDRRGRQESRQHCTSSGRT